MILEICVIGIQSCVSLFSFIRTSMSYDSALLARPANDLEPSFNSIVSIFPTPSKAFLRDIALSFR